MSLVFSCMVCHCDIDPTERGQGNRKYCVPCARKIRNKDRHKKRVRSPLGEKIIYLLKTNKMVTKGELLAFTGSSWGSIRTTLSILRMNGHKVKFAFDMYHYGGHSPKSRGDNKT